MREIKFRAWDKHNERWVYETVSNICNAVFFNDTSALDLPNSSCDDDIIEIYCLYTGLKDKNGKEIYEGDIVKIKDDYEDVGFMAGEIREVYFFEGGFRLKPLSKERGRGHWCEDGEDLEVIGNIYENPELLKESV